MTVKEVIEALQKCPEELEVRMNNNTIDGVVLYKEQVVGGDYICDEDYVDLK